MTVRTAGKTESVLSDVLGFKKAGSYPSSVMGQPDILVYTIGECGPRAEVHIEECKDLPVERAERGSVHHVAFRVKTVEEYEQWSDKLRALDLQTSGEVDRFYCHSIYFSEPNGILYELATDEPDFT